MFETPNFVADYAYAAEILTSPDVQFDPAGAALLVENASLAATKMTPYEFHSQDSQVIASFAAAGDAATLFAPSQMVELMHDSAEDELHYRYRTEIDRPLQNLHTALVAGNFLSKPERIIDARRAAALASTAFTQLLSSEHHVVALYDYQASFAATTALVLRRAKRLDRDE